MTDIGAAPSRRSLGKSWAPLSLLGAAVIAAAVFGAESGSRGTRKEPPATLTSVALCERDMRSIYTSPHLPTPMRLKHDVVVGQDFLLSPAPRSFVPQADAARAWRGILGTDETHVILHVYLAEITDQLAANAHANAPFEPQVAWIAIADHDAGIDDSPIPPGVNVHLPACAYFQVFDAVSATTGQGLVSGSG